MALNDLPAAHSEVYEHDAVGREGAEHEQQSLGTCDPLPDALTDDEEDEAGQEEPQPEYGVAYARIQKGDLGREFALLEHLWQSPLR